MKTSFRDRQEKYNYLCACEVAAMIVEEPNLIASARDFVELHMANDPNQSSYTAIWRSLLDKPPVEIAALLVEDSPQGEIIRDTRPVFRPLPNNVRSALLDKARQP